LLSTFTPTSANDVNAQQTVDRFNLMKATLDACRDTATCRAFLTMLLSWDTGASFGLTPFKADFIDYVECDIPVKDVTKVNKVIGMGTTLHKFKNDKGDDVYLPCISYHLPTAEIRLFSPQTYHQMHGGYSTVSADEVKMHLKGHTIVVPIDKGESNLPMVFTSAVTNQEKQDIGVHFTSKLALSGLRQLDAFDGLLSKQCQLNEELDAEFNTYSQLCVRVWALMKMRIFQDRRKNCCFGIGSWASVCIGFRN
jgi:hypothetical protein